MNKARIKLVLLLMFLSSYSQAEIVKLNDAQIAASGISVGPMNKATLSFGKNLPGQVVVPPAKLQIVSAPQSGMIEQLLVAAGDSVKKGDLIAFLQSPEMIAAQRDFLQSVAQLELVAQTLKRDESLLKEGVIAQRRYQESQSKFQELTAAVAERRQALKLAGMHTSDISRLEKNQQINPRLEIHSVIDGVVLDVYAEPGQRLSMSDPIYRIGMLDTLWLEIRAPLEVANDFKIGDGIHIHGQELNGKLIAIGRSVDDVSQTVLLRAEVIKNAEKLRPGQYVQVAHVVETKETRFQLPSIAIARSGDQAFVFVKVAEGFDIRPVTVHGLSGENAIISGDFTGDEQVAVSGIAAIKGAWAGLGGGE